MTNQWIWAVLLSGAVTVAWGDRQPETTQNPAAETPAAAENAGVAEPGPAVDPGRSAPAASPRRDDSAATGTSSRSAAVPDTDRTAPRRTAQPPAPRWREVTVPAGTALPLELLTAVSSETAQVETPVRARLRQAVSVDNYTALPAGTVLHGTVVDVDRAGRVQGRARLAFRFTEAEIDGGREEL